MIKLKKFNMKTKNVERIISKLASFKSNSPLSKMARQFSNPKVVTPSLMARLHPQLKHWDKSEPKLLHTFRRQTLCAFHSCRGCDSWNLKASTLSVAVCWVCLGALCRVLCVFVCRVLYALCVCVLSARGQTPHFRSHLISRCLRSFFAVATAAGWA